MIHDHIPVDRDGDTYCQTCNRKIFAGTDYPYGNACTNCGEDTHPVTFRDNDGHCSPLCAEITDGIRKDDLIEELQKSLEAERRENEQLDCDLADMEHRALIAEAKLAEFHAKKQKLKLSLKPCGDCWLHVDAISGLQASINLGQRGSFNDQTIVGRTIREVAEQ